MFALHVRKLDGSCERIELSPEATMSDLRARLEVGLPDFGEVRIFQGTREVVDGSTFDIEVTAVVAKSPAKILKALERTTAAARAHYIEQHARHAAVSEREDTWEHDANGAIIFDAYGSPMPTSSSLEFFETFARSGQGNMQVVRSVKEALGEIGTLTPDNYSRLLECLTTMSNYTFVDAELQSLAAISGGACGDPMPHGDQLLQFLRTSYHHGRIAGAVCLDIVARRGKESLPREVCTGLTEWALLVANMPYECVHEWGLVAVRVLGQIGDATHENVLLAIVGDDQLASLHSDARAALVSIRGCVEPATAEEATLDNAVVATDNEAAAPAAMEVEALDGYRNHPDAERNTKPDIADIAEANASKAPPHSGVLPLSGDSVEVSREADMDFNLALAASERDALLLEQEELHEVILRSKAERLPHSAGPSTRSRTMAWCSFPSSAVPRNSAKPCSSRASQHDLPCAVSISSLSGRMAASC